MAFSIQEIGRIDHIVGDWCIRRVPPEIKKKLDNDYEIDGQVVTLLEVRPLWQGLPGEFTRTPFAKFRFVKTVAFGRFTGGVRAENGRIMSLIP